MLLFCWLFLCLRWFWREAANSTTESFRSLATSCCCSWVIALWCHFASTCRLCVDVSPNVSLWHDCGLAFPSWQNLITRYVWSSSLSCRFCRLLRVCSHVPAPLPDCRVLAWLEICLCNLEVRGFGNRLFTVFHQLFVVLGKIYRWMIYRYSKGTSAVQKEIHSERADSSRVTITCLLVRRRSFIFLINLSIFPFPRRSRMGCVTTYIRVVVLSRVNSN